MMNCPKCQALMGENLTRCPACFHEITAAEFQKMEQEKEAEEKRIEEEAIQEYARRRKAALGLTALLEVTLLIAGIILVCIKANTLIIYGVFTIIGVIFWAKSMSSGADLCPYCNAYTHRRGVTFLQTNCSYHH